MISTQMLSFIQALVILCTPSFSYPLYGSQRYNNGRSSAVRMINDNYSWGTPVLPYQQFARTQRVPVNYYDLYPYAQDYKDDYYSVQEPITYPVYIPAPRTSKYEVYQAVLPYYYGQRTVPRQNYGHYDYDRSSDPLDTLEKEMQHETELEQREQAQPIGTEVLYENDNDDENINDVNAAFVQNLIMSQMYEDATKQKDYYDPEYSNTDYYYDENNYGHWENSPVSPEIQDKEDKDVRELKQLAQIPKPKNKFKTTGPTAEDRMSIFRNEKQKNSKNNNVDTKRNLRNANKKEEIGEYGTLVYATNDLAFSDRKPTVSISSTISPLAPKIIVKSQRKDAKNGQKEEVLMRPATPVRRPFAGTVHERSSGEYERKREPSVYDTIKHMLDMEKSLENNNRVNDLRPPMRKRIVSSEDSLTHQLSVLKKTQ